MRTRDIAADLPPIYDGKYPGGYKILDARPTRHNYGPEGFYYEFLLDVPYREKPEWVELNIEGVPPNAHRLDISIDPAFVKGFFELNKTKMPFSEFVKKWDHDHRGQYAGEKFGF